jgi:hypothetical protein
MLNVNVSKANLCNHKINEDRDLIGETRDKDIKCCFCQESTHNHIELGRLVLT